MRCFVITDYAAYQEKVIISVIVKLKIVKTNKKQHYISHMCSEWYFLIISAQYCHFFFSFLSSVLVPILLFLLILLYVVTPRPALRHHHSLICSHCLGNPVCLLIPSTYSSPILPSYFLFLPQESLVTSQVPSGTSWNKQSRDGNEIWTELKRI